MEWNVVYVRFNGCKSFKAFDLGEGRLVGNLIYASLLEDTEENRRKLQELSELNSDCGLVLQRGEMERWFSKLHDAKVTGRPTIVPLFQKT